MKHYVWNEACNEAVEMDDAWVILNPATFTVTKLNEAGGLCWNMLREPCSPETLAEALRTSYAISAEEANADVQSFLEQMEHIGLVRHAG
ncbi:PqqD family protein [Paenibacillus daejeonensis]|uniref:PqqD family protein n=1 Tax=Paenibacillus daejeonensis TaxID=135193 RepID=UPI00036A2C04|nr:PqqD family protein [Paenibacillus daejeonensis]